MSSIQAGDGFILKRWDVTVNGYGTSVYLASTRGKALADAWRSDAFWGSTFGEFLKHARCRRSPVTFPGFGAPITVAGEAAHYVGNDSQYVQFVRPGGDVVLNSHPSEVQPEQYRPREYRSTYLAEELAKAEAQVARLKRAMASRNARAAA